MTIQARFLALLFFSCTFALLSSCQLQENGSQTSFEELTGVNSENFDTGLELVTDNLVIDLSEANWFTFDVVNSAQESIEFQNVHFSLRVFQYNSDGEEWTEIPLAVKPKDKLITLPPGDRYDNLPMNSFSLHSDDFDTLLSETNLRFFITGKGYITRDTYGAYVDIPVQLP